MKTSPGKTARCGRPPGTAFRGFALVVTLSLMILLTVIAVGLLSLASVSLRTTSQESAMAEARANARLALILALGSLQKEMGPDSRISAPGGQQLAADSASGRKHWTGVYQAWPAATTNYPAEPVFRGWLISGKESVVQDRASVATDSSFLAPRTVELVSADRLGGKVEAGIVNVPGRNPGGHAWWIADNHTKAKLGGSIRAPADATEAMAAMQSAPRAAHEPFIGDSIIPEDLGLNKIVTLKSLDLLAAPDTSIFHDATAMATGLVTNVRSGGFRRDLSFLLEKPYSQISSSYAAQTLYKVNSTGGINLRELWVDHNIWGEIQTSGIPSPHADGGAMPGGLPHLVPPATVAAAYADPFKRYRQLTRVQHTVIFSLISRPAPLPAPPGRYDLFLVMDPVTTLWNPFDITVALPPNNAAFSNFYTYFLPYFIKLYFESPSGNTTWERQVHQVTGTDVKRGYAHVGRTRDENFVMRPGEVQVLSQSYRDKVQIADGTIDSKLGLGFGSGFAFKLPGISPLTGETSLTYSMRPSDVRNPHGIGVTYSPHFLGNREEPIGNFSADWASPGVRNSVLLASQFPSVFRSVDRDLGYRRRVAEMVVEEGAGNSAAQKWPLCIFTMGLRTEEDTYRADYGKPGSLPPSRYTGRSLLRMGPKAFLYDLSDLSPQALRENPMQMGLRPLDSFTGKTVDSTATGLGYFGASHEEGAGSSHVITHSVPRAPYQSIGALQNSHANGHVDPPAGSDEQRLHYLRPAISHAIGNSFAPSIMTKSQTQVTRGSGKFTRDLADHSYLANRALWDDYFYSSISPKTVTAHRSTGKAYAEQKARLAAFLGTEGNPREPLPNSRFLPWAGDPQAALKQFFPSSSPASFTADRIAAHLLIDGAFNVNSTSVPAWKSFLSGLKGASVPVGNAESPTAEPALVKDTDTPVPGLMVPGSGKIDESAINDTGLKDQWTGFRSLTDSQLGELAEAIVKQVRLRGPFLSLSDFVNRRPGNDTDLALAGALQSALDDPDVSINDKFRNGARSLGIAQASADGYEFPEAEAGVKSVGAPGYVLQGDLLTSMGPLIAVRGDTFTIRSYGESRDAAGKVLARVRCEATVQRTPEYLDPADAAHVANPVSAVNRSFGRRFGIVAFRYLKPEEI